VNNNVSRKIEWDEWVSAKSIQTQVV